MYYFSVLASYECFLWLPLDLSGSTLKRFAGPGTSNGSSGWCPRNLTHTISADLKSFLRGLALWINEGIETGRWGNGAEDVPYSPDSKNLLLSEIVRGGSDKERVDLKGQTRHSHLDMDGMEIDAEPETLVACGELDEEIAVETSSPMDPIMTVMDILWRVEGILKEVDTCI